MITEEQLFDLRVLANEPLDKACGGSYGRKETDPIARALTEQRDGGKDRDKFSSCGELPMWMFELLGVRLPWLVFPNREPLVHLAPPTISSAKTVPELLYSPDLLPQQAAAET